MFLLFYDNIEIIFDTALISVNIVSQECHIHHIIYILHFT